MMTDRLKNERRALCAFLLFFLNKRMKKRVAKENYVW